MTGMDPTSTAATIAIFVGAFTLAGIFTRIIHDIYRWARRIENAIGYVESEMRLNGGTTIRDAIHRIEVQCGAIHGWDGSTDRRAEHLQVRGNQ